jgi:hypothetical protein
MASPLERRLLSVDKAWHALSLEVSKLDAEFLELPFEVVSDCVEFGVTACVQLANQFGKADINRKFVGVGFFELGLNPFVVGGAGIVACPAGCGLCLVFGCDADADPAVQRDAFELDVEALAIGVRPYAADAGPDALGTLAVAYLVGDVAGAFAGRFGFLVRHGLVPFLIRFLAATIAA